MLAVVTAVVLVLIAAGFWVLPFQLGLALYTLATICERRLAVLAGSAAALAVIVALAASGQLQFGDSLSRLVFLLALWLLGDSIGSRRAYVREIEEKADRLERGREADARRAAAEEQARIARELHDVVAHALSVIVVQAAAADDVFELEPARAREPIRAIETAARAALGDLRRVLGVLHDERGLRAAARPRHGSTASSSRCARPASRSRSRFRARRGRCRRRSTCPPTASSRRRSPTR